MVKRCEMATHRKHILTTSTLIKTFICLQQVSYQIMNILYKVTKTENKSSYFKQKGVMYSHIISKDNFVFIIKT